MMDSWFINRYPERLQIELQALKDAGYEFDLNEDERKAGRIIITIKYPLDGEVHDLIVVFPENYPYFPFEMTSPTFPSGRHKDPYTGSLCLLKDPQKSWKVKDRLASILDTQLPKITKAHRDISNASNLEAHEATQITGQLHYQPSMVVFTGEWQIPHGSNHGYISIGLESNNDPNKILRGAVLEVQNKNGGVLATLDNAMSSRYMEKIDGRWVRLPCAPTSTNPADILHEAISIWPDLKTPKFNKGPDIVGILIPEEVQYGKYHENWFFIVRIKTHAKRGSVTYGHYLVRSDQASFKAMRARSPKLSAIANKKVLIVGLGSLGSVFAWEMARSGVGSLHLLDFDHLQLGNIPRWMYGCGAVGHSKAQVLTHYLQHDYPYVKTTFSHHRIGGVKYTHESLSDLDVLPIALEGIDMIVDTTAEWCVSHYLSELAKEKGIPYLWATGTPGGWGGVVGRVVPNQTAGCWKCYQRHMTDGTIKQPNQEDIPDVQPVGCFHPTFTGAGFDMDHVTLAVVRLAVSTLCLGEKTAYPNFKWDVGVVDLWEKDGTPIAPMWHTYKLEKHPECDCHE